MTKKKSKNTRRATVRTYRHGLGDCHLITLYEDDGTPFTIMIDCGVILGTPDASKKLTAVMDDIVATTEGTVDLLVATHEHGDHVSGFVQAGDSFARLTAKEVWMAWTEDPKDKQARQLQGERDQALGMLEDTAVRLRMDDQADDHPVLSMLEFFGAAGRLTTKSALEAVRSKVETPRYCDPKDAPVEIGSTGARIYVLGPPRDIALLKKTSPSKSAPETYTLALDAFQSNVLAGLSNPEVLLPFSGPYRIPMKTAKDMPFFQTRYWDNEPWRRIDVAWMDDATQLALALDNMTNNTSLVLAIELKSGDVLLFAADAQVGNWLSWGSCNWQVGDQTVTGTDLLGRTLVYKVGHHGSHNATLRTEGLERMEKLYAAVIPVDHEMALKKRWGNIPFNSIETALDAVTTANRGFVVRTDEPLSEAAAGCQVRETPLYYEFDV